MTTADGRSAVISLAGLKEPGLNAASSLSVTPHVRPDGAITLLIDPRFRFVRAAGPNSKQPSVSTDPFPLTRTVPDGGTMVFTEEPASLKKDTQEIDGPFVTSISGHLVIPDASEMLVFLTATVLPDASAAHTTTLNYNMLLESSTMYRPGEHFWAVRKSPRNDAAAPPPPVVFKTFAALRLRQWISQLPPGTEITIMYTMGGGHKPARAAFEAEIDDFVRFCRKNKLQVGFLGSVL